MNLRHGITCFVAVLCAFVLQGLRASTAESAKTPRVFAAAPRDDAAAARAFSAIVPVLRHARCINCHSKGDFPRQGDDSHQHTMNVRRGYEGNGIAGVKCSTCHQEHNLAGAHMPPGAPDWHLPPPNMPMIWEGLSEQQLCELFKDAKQNGNRSLDEIVEHMQTPPVRWGWNPGEGRAPVPGTFDQFISNVKAWAAKGGACPGEASASATRRVTK